eukprot:scaffold2707_cov169-Amphora_coffeaeformis.AAC.3
MRLFQTLTILVWISLVSARVGTRDDEDNKNEEDLEESLARNLRFVSDPAGNTDAINTDGGNTDGGNTGENAGGRFTGGNTGVNPDTFTIAGQPVPDQFIIQLSRADGDRGKRILGELLRRNPDVTIIGTFTTVFYGYAINGLSGSVLQNLAAQNPDVILSLEQDTYVETTAVGSWGLDRIDELTLPLDGNYITPNGLDGSGVDIYIIDTGLRADHNDFRNRVKPGRSFVGGQTNDANGHGTAAGTVYGVAKRASIIPVKVLGDNGSGTITGVINGVEWVADQHADNFRDNRDTKSVANMSLGGGSSSSLNSAVNSAANAGVVMVVAGGNENSNACNYSPAAATRAISVGSTTTSDTRSSFSNTGSCLEIFAPGSSIRAASNAGSTTASTTKSGTSMASPREFYYPR